MFNILSIVKTSADPLIYFFNTLITLCCVILKVTELLTVLNAVFDAESKTAVRFLLLDLVFWQISFRIFEN